jgi:hypothetical protein
MASVSELKKLSRTDLNTFAVANGIEDAADESKYKDKEALAQVVSPVVTPEQLAEFKANMQAPAAVENEVEVVEGIRYFKDGDKICAVDDEEFVNLQESPAGFGDTKEEAYSAFVDAVNGAGVPADPAAAPVEVADPALTPAADDAEEAELVVGQRVLYPYDGMESGFRLGRVNSFDDVSVELVYADGSLRTFGRAEIKLEK